MTVDELRLKGTIAISLASLVLSLCVAVVEYFVQGGFGLGTGLAFFGLACWARPIFGTEHLAHSAISP